MKNYPFIIFSFIVLLVFLFSNFYSIEKVSKVIDGDTIKLEDGKTVRLIGINAPEINKEYYKEAKDKLESLVEGKKIRLEKDLTERDEYGRLLRYVFVGDMFVNSEMIRLGLARFEEVGNNKKYSDLFLEMENKAKKAKRCIWKNQII